MKLANHQFPPRKEQPKTWGIFFSYRDNTTRETENLSIIHKLQVTNDNVCKNKKHEKPKHLNGGRHP